MCHLLPLLFQVGCGGLRVPVCCPSRFFLGPATGVSPLSTSPRTSPRLCSSNACPPSLFGDLLWPLSPFWENLRSRRRRAELLEVAAAHQGTSSSARATRATAWLWYPNSAGWGPLYNYLIFANFNVCISDSLRFSFGCSHYHIQECL